MDESSNIITQKGVVEYIINKLYIGQLISKKKLTRDIYVFFDFLDKFTISIINIIIFGCMINSNVNVDIKTIIKDDVKIQFDYLCNIVFTRINQVLENINLFKNILSEYNKIYTILNLDINVINRYIQKINLINKIIEIIDISYKKEIFYRFIHDIAIFGVSNKLNQSDNQILIINFLLTSFKEIFSIVVKNNNAEQTFQTAEVIFNFNLNKFKKNYNNITSNSDYKKDTILNLLTFSEILVSNSVNQNKFTITYVSSETIKKKYERVFGNSSELEDSHKKRKSDFEDTCRKREKKAIDILMSLKSKQD
jgi:hypothetical protein